MIRGLQTLCARMTRLAELGDQFAAACVRGDARDARRWLARSRQVRAEIARAQGVVERAGAPDTPEGVRLLARARALCERLQLGDEAVQLWLNRPLPPDVELLASAEGVAAYTDALLPAAWDYGADLVVLLGGGLAGPARELIGQGQRRVAALCPADSAHAYPSEVVVAENVDDLQAAVLQMSPDPPTRVVSKRCPGDEVSAELQAEAMAVVERALADVRVHFNTLASFAETWIEQGLANMPAVAASPSIDAVGERFRGVPMVIVAPGPSLERNVHLLPELAGKALIVTFSHTMKALAAAGVVPDLVLSVDPQDVRYHFEGVSLDGVAALVNGVTVHPGLYALDVPRHLTFAANSALDDWIYEALGAPARLPAGGSVATSACALGLRWGCDPIVFVGLDLSFSAGQYYIGTSCDGGTKVQLSDDGDRMVVAGWSDDYSKLHMVQGDRQTRPQQVIELPGYHGGTVRSSFVFSLFHRWFEDQAKLHAGDTRMINATEGGARIAGTEQLTLAEVVDALADRRVDCARALTEVARHIDPRERRRALVARVDEQRAAVGRVRELATRCGKLAARGDETALGALDDAERELSVALAPVMFVSLLAQDEISAAAARARAAETVEATLVASRELFAVIVGAAEWLAPRLDAAARNLR